jgi:hypothetical protein
MSILLVGILIIGGLAAAAAVAVAIPALVGAMVWDRVDARRNAPAEVRDARLRIALERNVARGFVIAGGAFWAIASFAGLFSFRESGVGYALIAAFLPLAACLATLVVGWYYERVASVVLVAAAIAIVAYGVIYQFEMGVWMIMGIFVLAPMLTASLLFWLARRDQEAYELALRLHPELATLAASER